MTVERSPWVTRWGADPDSWNIEEADEDGGSDGSGFPGRDLVGEAVARWGLTQPAEPTAAIVAAVFNLPIDLASEAMGFEPGRLSNALQVWSGLQGHGATDVSVGQAAVAFHLAPALIAEAVEAHAWMFLSGDRANPAAMIIEHEGE